MKRIIIFRHGEYDGSGELDADGAKAVFARAKLIRRETAAPQRFSLLRYSGADRRHG